MIGACELIAVVGLQAGLAFGPLAIVTAAAVCVLMAGALGYHNKARDKLPAMLARRHHRCRGASGLGAQPRGSIAVYTGKDLFEMLLPLASERFTAPTDRDMLPSKRRESVRTHRTCIYGYRRLHDGPAMSVVSYIRSDDDEVLVSTIAGRGKARAVDLDGKVSLCVLDERWPFAYLQVYADAENDRDRDRVVDVMMAVAGRMSGQPLGDETRSNVEAMAVEENRVVVPLLRDFRATAAPPVPQRSSRKDHTLDVGHRPWDAPDPM